MSDETAETQTMTVDEAVRRVCLELDPVAKNDRSKGTAAYNYRGRDAVVDALSPLLARHGVSVVPSGVRDVTTEWVTDNNGRVERLVCGYYSFDVRGPAGDSYTTEMYAEGMNTRDKASGAAMSYAYRYALEMIFALPTSAPENEELNEPAGPIHQEDHPPMIDAHVQEIRNSIRQAGSQENERALGLAVSAKFGSQTHLVRTAADLWESQYDDVVAFIAQWRPPAQSDSEASTPDPAPSPPPKPSGPPQQAGITPDEAKALRLSLLTNFASLRGPTEHFMPTFESALDEIGLWPISDIPDDRVTEARAAVQEIMETAAKEEAAAEKAEAKAT